MRKEYDLTKVRGRKNPYAQQLGQSVTRVATTKDTYTVASHFTKSSPLVRAIYKAILAAARELGPVREEAKKTSIHLVRNKAFAGVATRKEALILTLKAERALKSPRVSRAEQASANRWHMELKLTAPDEVDAELRAWLEQAYELA